MTAIAPGPSAVTGEERTMSAAEYEVWAAEVRRLADERGAVVLAHNYQVPEIQDVAHFTGDSLYLSRVAAELEEVHRDARQERPRRRTVGSTGWPRSTPASRRDTRPFTRRSERRSQDFTRRAVNGP